MGTSLSSIHIFSDSAPADCGYSFRSFSPNWQTCVDDLSEKYPDEIYQAARFISRHTDAPVLHLRENHAHAKRVLSNGLYKG